MVALLGIAMLVAGVVLLVRSWFGAAEADTLASAATVTAADLEREFGRGADAPRRLVEVKGALRSDAPVTAPRSGRACAAYVTAVTRRFEEELCDHAPGGALHQRRRVEEAVSEQRDEAVCYVDDGTGRVEVALAGANLEMTEVVDTFTPEEGRAAPPLLQDAAAALSGEAVTRRLLGLQQRESILPLGEVVHVVGEVRTEAGRPRIWAGRGEPVRVSRESKEKRVEATRGSASTGRFLGVFLLLHGAVLLVLGLR